MFVIFTSYFCLSFVKYSTCIHYINGYDKEIVKLYEIRQAVPSIVFKTICNSYFVI